MRLDQIREKSDADLREELQALRANLFENRFRGGQEEVGARGKLRKIRRDAARVLTILRERELGLRSPKSAAGGKEG